MLKACPLLREDSVAHSAEHSLEVQIPFLQVLAPLHVRPHRPGNSAL